MNRLLATGGSGFIGRHVMPLVAARGWELHVATRGERERPGASGIVWHVTDLRSAREAASLVQTVRPTHLLHLAWNAEHGRYWAAPDNEEWADAAVALARAFVESGGRRFVGAGTCAEYDWRNLSDPCRENVTPLDPQTPYGRAKLRAWRGIEELFASASGATAVWGRLFLLYGEGEDTRRLIPSVVRALRAGQRPQVSAGTQRRDFLHVRDAAGAFDALLASELPGPVNIGSGDAVTIREVVEKLCLLAGRPGQADFGALPMQPGEPPLLVADVARLTSVGWRRAVPLEQGLSAALATPG